MKTVLITGVSRGIGKATAEKFLSEGWCVLGTSTSGSASLKHENLKVYKLDLFDSESIKSFISSIILPNCKIDVLINNSAINLDTNQSITIETLRKTLEVNVIGLIDLTEQLLKQINSGGHIINLSSGLGSLADANDPYYTTYRISKVSVNMYTRTLAARLKSKNITVSAIDPGWVKTDMGGAGATRNPIEPAKEIFDLANSNVDTGYFWYKGKKKAW